MLEPRSRLVQQKRKWAKLVLCGSVFGGFLGATGGVSAQQLQLAQPPAFQQDQAAGQARLQTYNLPPQLIGTVGAQLQLAYHDQPEVRVTTDPKSGQLMIMAPEAVHRRLAQQIQEMMHKNGITQRDLNPAANIYNRQDYTLQHLSWRELEDALVRLGGPRLAVTTERNGEIANLTISNGNGTSDVLQVDRRTNQITMLGSGPAVMGWSQVIRSLDEGQADQRIATHVVPLGPAEPRKIRQAIRLVNMTTQQAQAGSDGGQTEARVQLESDDQATAMGSLDTIGSGSGLFGDVQIEFIPEIDLVVIRGSKDDVQRTLDVIEKIKSQADETQPEVEVLVLQHANGQAVAQLVDQLYEEIYLPRQGAVSITALVQPNALLLIGRKEVVQSVKDLVAKIDQPLDPQHQLKVRRLENASAVDVEERIRLFFVEQPGVDDALRGGLGTRVKIISDYRTNSLIIQASPREMLEVENLVAELDVSNLETESAVQVFRLKNTLAEDLQTVIQDVIGGQTTGADESLATPPSSKLSLVRVDNGKIESGILANVIISADPSVNALVVRAPVESMALIAALIDELDSLPSAEARIKVFQLTNGDATTLAQTLQSLFGLAVTAGQGSQGNFLNNLSRSGLTTGGESSLVQLQIAAEARTNSVIVSGSKSDLEVLEALVLRLDEDVVEQRRTEVIWLRNATAGNVQIALTTYFQELATAQQTLSNGLTQILSQQELVNRRVFVVAEGATNSILLSASPDYFEQALRLIERLDRRPPMVAMQILIAEIQLDDDFELGAEWGLQDGLLFDRQSATGGTLGSPVFNLGNVLAGPSAAGLGATQNVAGQALSSFGVGRANAAGTGGLVLSASSEAIGVLIRALQTSNRLQILNRPQLTTLDSQQATAQVGQSVPRVTGISQAGLGVPQQIQTTDEDVGLLLTVLPRVSPDGLILMQVGVENSSVGDPNAGIPIGFGANGEVIRSPIINRTRAETVVSAYSGQTVVFAGLISKQRSSARSQIPFLGSLPLIGAAFRFDVETEQRRELLVVLTPRIIQTDEDYEVLKDVESSRMSWCLADVLNMHGDVGLSAGNGLWGPAKSAVIHPDMPTATLQDRSPQDPRLFDPNYNNQINGTYAPQMLDAYPNSEPGSIIESAPMPILENGADVSSRQGAFQQASYSMPQYNPAPQQAPTGSPQLVPLNPTVAPGTASSSIQQGAYR